MSNFRTRYPNTSGKEPEDWKSRFYVKVDIPGDWWFAARAACHGTDRWANVLLFIFHCRAVRLQNPFRPMMYRLPAFGVSRDTYYDITKRLHQAGLVCRYRRSRGSTFELAILQASKFPPGKFSDDTEVDSARDM